MSSAPLGVLLNHDETHTIILALNSETRRHVSEGHLNTARCTFNLANKLRRQIGVEPWGSFEHYYPPEPPRRRAFG